MKQVLAALKERALKQRSALSPEGLTGLVVQGGGMRGAYSMGALMAIAEMGYGCAFDHVFGSSAGAINGAYLLAQQAPMAVSVYVDDITTRDFINFLRLNRIVDIDFLVDEVLSKRKCLDVGGVLSAPSLLHIALTDADTGKLVYVTNRDGDIELMEVLRATAAMPILYNKVVDIGGRRYIDGGVLDPVPLLPAIETGCTSIVVVLTRPLPIAPRPPGLLIRMLERLYLHSYPPATRRAVSGLQSTYDETVELINHHRDKESFRLLLVYPGQDADIAARTTRDRKVVLETAFRGWHDTRQAFEDPAPRSQFLEGLKEYLRPA